MEPNINEIAERIHDLREISDLTIEEMADAAGVSVEEYEQSERGNRDFSFTFLYKCAKKFGVDMTELLTGESPHLSGYTVVRAGEGLPIRRRESFQYNHLAANFKKKLAEPFIVTAPYREKEQNAPIALSYHTGQEFDYIISGTMRFAHEDHIEELGPGDSVYYDSGRGHGMIATSKEGCTFLAIVLRENER